MAKQWKDGEGATVTFEEDDPKAKGKGESKPTKGKGEQEKLIDLDHPKDKGLIAAIKKYREARDARMELTKTEVDAQSAMLAIMRDRKITEYVHDGFRATLVEGKAKVKVKSLEDTTDDDE